MNKMKYIRNLDYLRFFLSVFVIFIHLNINNITILNTWFVDPVLLFFAISGYSNFISWKKKETVLSYYKKRILTLLISGLIVSLIVDLSYYTFHISELNNINFINFATLSFIKSFIIHPLLGLIPYFSHILPNNIDFPGTWNPLFIDKSNPVLWSLRIELLFYLIFPFIMKLYFYFEKWKISPLYLLPLIALLVQHFLFNNVFAHINLNSLNGKLHSAITKSPLLLKDLGIYNPLKILNIYLPHFFIGIFISQIYQNHWKKMWICARKYKIIITTIKYLFLVKLFLVLFTLLIQILSKKNINISIMPYYNSTSLFYYYFIEWVGIFIVFMFGILWDLSIISIEHYNDKYESTKKKLNLGLVTYILYVSHPYMIKLFTKKTINKNILNNNNYLNYGLKKSLITVLCILILILTVTIITYVITNYFNKWVLKKHNSKKI